MTSYRGEAESTKESLFPLSCWIITWQNNSLSPSASSQWVSTCRPRVCGKPIFEYIQFDWPDHHHLRWESFLLQWVRCSVLSTPDNIHCSATLDSRKIRPLSRIRIVWNAFLSGNLQETMHCSHLWRHYSSHTCISQSWSMVLWQVDFVLINPLVWFCLRDLRNFVQMTLKRLRFTADGVSLWMFLFFFFSLSLPLCVPAGLSRTNVCFFDPEDRIASQHAHFFVGEKKRRFLSDFASLRGDIYSLSPYIREGHSLVWTSPVQRFLTNDQCCPAQTIRLGHVWCVTPRRIILTSVQSFVYPVKCFSVDMLKSAR